MDAVYIGIDVSKDRLDVHILPSQEAFGVERSGKGVAELGQRLLAVSPSIVAMEATGGFETVVAAGLGGAGLPVVVINPVQIRAFAKAIGQRAKSDPIDAAVIARFAQATRPEIRPLPDEATRLLADLVGRRRQIVDMLTAERQRQMRTTARALVKSIKRLIAALERELQSVNDEIDGAVRASPLWREKEDLLRSVPSIGPATARTLIADMPELGNLSAKKIGSLAGLVPFVRKSGRWKGKSFIGGGRKTVRSALFIAAMVASRRNPILAPFYQRLLAAGKPKMVALIAVARKLLTILNAILRNKTPWQPQNA
jgi:transposase